MFKNFFKRKYYRLTEDETEMIDKLIRLTDIDRYSITLDIDSVNEEFIEYYNYIITIKNTYYLKGNTWNDHTITQKHTNIYSIEYQSDGYIRIVCDGTIILHCDLTNNKDINNKLDTWIDTIKNNRIIKENNKIKPLITKFLDI